MNDIQRVKNAMSNIATDTGYAAQNRTSAATSYALLCIAEALISDKKKIKILNEAIKSETVEQ